MGQAEELIHMPKNQKLVTPAPGLRAKRELQFSTADEFCSAIPTMDPKTAKKIETQVPSRLSSIAKYCQKLGIPLAEGMEPDASLDSAILGVDLGCDFWGGELLSYGNWPDYWESPEPDVFRNPDIQCVEKTKTVTALRCDAKSLTKLLSAGSGKGELDGREVRWHQIWKLDSDVPISEALSSALKDLKHNVDELTKQTKGDASLDALVKEISTRTLFETALVNLEKECGVKIFGCHVSSYFFEEHGYVWGGEHLRVEGLYIKCPLLYLAPAKYQECKITYLAIESEEEVLPF